jgi:ribonuclease HIII
MKPLDLAQINFINLLKNSDIHIESAKEINYGIQYRLTSENHKISLNIYFSEKKGISYVLGGSDDNPLKNRLKKMLGMQESETIENKKWSCWLGTDESGKGDFFGPLVCAGFICKKVMINQLKGLGVADSKVLKEQDIKRIGKALQARFQPFIEIIILQPEKYNELYKNFSEQKKKLNELLAWMHVRILKNSYQKMQFEGVLIDKFTSERVIKNALKDLPKIEMILQEKAESDVAVAAASILARYHFVNQMEKMEEKFQTKFPKGANKRVIDTAREFSQKYGKNRLNEVAKLHFKTYNEI